MNSKRILIGIAAVVTVVAASMVGPLLLDSGWSFAAVATICSLTCAAVAAWAGRVWASDHFRRP